MLDAVVARLASIGADPRDDPDTRQSKALLVVISLVIVPIALLWGGLYLALGSVVGVVPLVYAVILLGAIVVFARTKNGVFLLRVNLADIVLALDIGPFDQRDRPPRIPGHPFANRGLSSTRHLAAPGDTRGRLARERWWLR